MAGARNNGPGCEVAFTLTDTLGSLLYRSESGILGPGGHLSLPGRYRIGCDRCQASWGPFPIGPLSPSSPTDRELAVCAACRSVVVVEHTHSRAALGAYRKNLERTRRLMAQSRMAGRARIEKRIRRLEHALKLEARAGETPRVDLQRDLQATREQFAAASRGGDELIERVEAARRRERDAPDDESLTGCPGCGGAAASIDAAPGIRLACPACGTADTAKIERLGERGQ